MSRLLCAVFVVLLISPSSAAEKTVTLAVQKMVCDLCTSAVRKSLEAVPGVAKAVVSLQSKTAVVTFDDEKADVKGLIDATTKAGYPSMVEQ